MLYIRPLLLFMLVVSTASCAAESSTEPSALPTVSSNHLAGAVVTRPAGGTCALTAIVVEPFPFSPPLFAPILNLEIEGVCEMKHLGRTTVVITEAVNLITGEVTNTGTWTAANGDQLMSEFIGEGTSVGPDNVFGGTLTYVSGTGRFQGVTGTLRLDGTSRSDTNPLVGEYRMKGTITY